MANDVSEMSDKELEKARNDANNTENIRNAADVAIASGNGYAVAIGTAVKAADAMTDGAATEFAGKVMTKGNKAAPGVQALSNMVNESGLGDKAGEAARAKNQYSGGSDSAAGAADKAQKAEGAANKAQNAQNAANKAKNAEDAANKTKNAQNAQNAQNTKKAEDATKKGQNDQDDNSKKGKKSKDEKSGGGHDSSLPSSDSKNDNDSDEEGSSAKGFLSIIKGLGAISIAFILAPLLFFILIIIIIVSSVMSISSEFNDALGMSQLLGEETGGEHFDALTRDQQEFYERISNVKSSFESEGVFFDALKIVALYHVLDVHGADLPYKNVSESLIKEWANAMLKDNIYDEQTFRNNMINSIFPHYLPNSTKDQYEEYADEVFAYIDNYNDLIGNKNSSSTCASMGSCTYDIKGFSYSGINVAKEMKISNLKVRLMQCGSPYGNGDYNKPISDELVDFEKYAAGVAYAEVGDGAPIEQYKTQIVAARSFALSRPSSMNNSRGLKLEQENGQWILQISSCVADQVHCDIDNGCHGTGGSQGGYVVSGDDSSAWYHKPKLPENHDIRKAATETQGEVLVNQQGYIINTGYLSTEQNLWSSLAKQGLNYKQILMKTYGTGGVRSSGASDIKKASCDGSGGSCAASGEWSSWRQADPQWGSIKMGGSNDTIAKIGCLVTSVSIQMARSGVNVSINPFNPGTFVEFLNKNGGIDSGGNFVWSSPEKAAPKFKYTTAISVAGMTRQQKLDKIKSLTSQSNVYVVAQVKGNTGEHWVAVIGVNGSTVQMVDPASDSTDMWGKYNWANTTILEYYTVR